jgi:hypothetical protein
MRGKLAVNAAIDLTWQGIIARVTWAGAAGAVKGTGIFAGTAGNEQEHTGQKSQKTEIPHHFSYRRAFTAPGRNTIPINGLYR